ncbi:MAG TPA: ACT domain-containing protein [Candidatus Methylacidiphilales bacterium]
MPSGLYPSIQVGTQLALFLANRPGSIGAAADVVSRAGVNILALTTSDTVDHMVLRIVVDKPKTALHALESHGTLVIETEVILLEGANRMGSLSTIANVLADAKINIDYAYCATPSTSKQGLLVLKPSDVPAALKALNKADLSRTGEKKYLAASKARAEMEQKAKASRTVPKRAPLSARGRE